MGLGAFFGLVALFLALDLFVFHREAHAVSMREAAAWSAVWMGLGIAFAGVVWAWQGARAAGEYLTAYLIDKSLSIDSLFVFAMIFSSFAVPTSYQYRVYMWSVVGAIVTRALFIAAGIALLERFDWVSYLFGGLLLLAGVKMVPKRHDELHPERNSVLRLARHVIPMIPEYRSQKFVVREGGRLIATPLCSVLLALITIEVIFTVDSIPAAFAVTRDPFLVLTGNTFSILGLGSLYFLLAGMIYRFAYLKYGLAAILVFVGVEMLASHVYAVPIWVSLAVIATVVLVAVIASLRATRRGAAEPSPAGA